MRAIINKIEILFGDIKYTLSQVYYYHIQPIFKDSNKRVRKAIPRIYIETDELIIEVSFAIIKEFYEKQYLNSDIDWTCPNSTLETAEWLELSYDYITNRRDAFIQYIDSLWEAMHFIPDRENNDAFAAAYDRLEKLEALLNKADTLVLEGLIKYRGELWI